MRVTDSLDERSRQLRHLAIDVLEGGGRGHVGSTFSLIEIMRVLYDDVMYFDATDPALESRDRLILSKGHGCIAQYVLLADKGFFPAEHLRTFCRFDSILGGHPERGHVPGVEASTGALGHGLAIGVGMAMGARMRKLKHKVFVVLGDGEIDEGSVWESALAAGHHGLDNLVVVVDYNKLQSYGSVVDVWSLEPLVDKWAAFGFSVVSVNGHNIESLRSGLSSAHQGRPLAVIANTIKGRGVSFAEGAPEWHHKASLSVEDIAKLRAAVEH